MPLTIWRIAPIRRIVRRLIDRGRFDAAEALLKPALARWPGNAALLESWARIAHDTGRHGEAETRWRALLAVAPHSAFGLTALAANQREQGDLDRAKVTIDAAIALRSDDIGVYAEAARIATARYDHDEAVGFWQRIVERPDAPPEWRQSRDWNLVMLGRLDEAEAAIARSKNLAPAFRGHAANEIMLRMAQGRWGEAVALARAYRACDPQDAGGVDLLGHALQGAAFADAESAGEMRHLPVEIEQVDDPQTRGLMFDFESLGEDCEFGLVQRRYGAEPLGLLRWNAVALPQLVEALGARFEGLGTETQTELGIFALGEYRVRDRRYGLTMHTFAYRHQVEPEALLPKVLARLTYLRDKFVEDLASAKKVFVYKSAVADLDAVRDLHRALRAYGPVRLVWVVPLDQIPDGLARGLPGEVRRLGGDFHVAFLTRFGPHGGAWTILFDEWVTICRRLVPDDGAG